MTEAYDKDNIFAKILRGEIPSHRVYEDDDTVAFMDVMPQGTGHALVLTKAPSRNLLDADPAVLGRLMETVQKIARAVKEAFEADGVMVIQYNEAPAGQTIFHLHVHVIPRFAGVPLKPHTGDDGGPAGSGHQRREGAPRAGVAGAPLPREIPQRSCHRRAGCARLVGVTPSGAPPMTPRLKLADAAPAAINALRALSAYVKSSGLEDSLMRLVEIRASQINGCANCLHMHTADARKAGESEERIYLLSAWHESNLYTPRERAALAWTEALTLLPQTHAPDAAYEQAAAQFSPTELVDLSLLIGAINTWNRLAVGFRVVHPNDLPRKAAKAA